MLVGVSDQVLLQGGDEAPQNGHAKSHGPTAEVLDTPVKEADEPGLRLWHQLDSSFQTPRSAAYFLFATPASYASPRAAAATHLLLRLLQDSLNETTYLADVAGLEFAVREPACWAYFCYCWAHATYEAIPAEFIGSMTLWSATWAQNLLPGWFRQE